MAVKKKVAAKVKKVAARPMRVAPKKTAPKKVAPEPVAEKAPERPVARGQEVIPLLSKPSARTCALVLDGITAPEKFSPRDCMSCDEFDCRFYAAEKGSGSLGSRLFAVDEGDEDLGDDDDRLDGFYGDGDADDDGGDDYDDDMR